MVVALGQRLCPLLWAEFFYDGSVHAYDYLHRYHVPDVVVGETGGICCIRKGQKERKLLLR